MLGRHGKLLAGAETWSEGWCVVLAAVLEKNPWQKRAEEGRVCVAHSVWVQPSWGEGMRVRGPWWQACAAETRWCLTSGGMGSTECTWGQMMGLPSRLVHHDPLSPAKLHPLKVPQPKQCHQLGTKCSHAKQAVCNEQNVGTLGMCCPTGLTGRTEGWNVAAQDTDGIFWKKIKEKSPRKWSSESEDAGDKHRLMGRELVSSPNSCTELQKNKPEAYWIEQLNHF